MQHIKHYSLCLLVVFALLLGALISAQPAMAALTGDGTSAHPYEIATADDLIEFAKKVNGGREGVGGDPDACAVLTDDIDLEGSEDNQWLSIGLDGSGRNYIGTFDGQGLTISGLYINTTSNTRGLFGYVGEGGTVTNLIVKGTVVSSGSAAYGDGGIVGDNAGTVSNCVSDVAVKSGYNVGGVVGWNRDTGIITNCTNNGTITGTSNDVFVGGVVGTNCGTVQNCTNNGAVETATYAGGVVGVNFGTVSGSYNTKNVAGVTAGGVVGANSYANVSGKVTSCYNTGTVTGTTTAGGVVGENIYGTSPGTPGTVTSCYNIGKVTAPSEGATIGGVVGANSNGTINGTVNGCYFLVETAASGVGDNSSTNVTNVTSKTTGEFATGEVAWLLQDALGENADQVWRQDISKGGYPVLHVFDASAPEVYQVTFKDGDSIFATDYANSGDTVTKPTDPTQTGYTFDGWYSDENLGQEWNFDTPITEDIPLYAKWTVCTYTVTFDTNGGTINSGNITEYTYGEGAKLPTDVTRPGYTFGGWYENSNFSGEPVKEISKTDTGNKTYYAKWLSANAGVSSVTVNGVTATLNDTTFTVTLPAGSSLPTADELQIIPATGADITAGPTTNDGGANWTFTVTAEDGTTTATYTIQVTIALQPTYTVTVSANPAEGGTVSGGGEATEGTKVTVTATPASGYHFVSWTENGETVSQEASYTFTLEANHTLTAIFEQDPVDPTPDPTPAPTPTPDPDPSGPSTGESDGWESIADEITAADDGDSITIDMNGETEVPADIFEDVAGKDVDLVFDMGDGLSWSVNGQDIPTDADLTDLDLGVDLGTDGIPVDVINAITGEKDSVQITLAYDGDFGFTLTLTAPLGEDNAGYWANLYHYDEDTEAMNFEAAAEIDADGSVSLPLSHASQYAIVIDDHSHAATDVSEIFTDVPANHWAQAAIQYVYDNGLMTGVSDTAFAPEATTTRAMIVSMLARMEGVTSAADAGFTDVAADDWYATAVNWAAANGIVNGISDDTFAPNDPITREQLAAMLMNYAQWKGQDTSARADLSGYSDAPSTWASEAVQWAVAEGLLAGVTDDELQPQGQATRAQVAAIMQRFLEA